MYTFMFIYISQCASTQWVLWLQFSGARILQSSRESFIPYVLFAGINFNIYQGTQHLPAVKHNLCFVGLALNDS